MDDGNEYEEKAVTIRWPWPHEVEKVVKKVFHFKVGSADHDHATQRSTYFMYVSLPRLKFLEKPYDAT
jgi:hypothetical protein